MRKFYLSVLLICFSVIYALSVNITVTMNSVSNTMTLKEKESTNNVETGEPEGYTYTIDIPAGEYILSAYDKDDNLNGTILIAVTDDEAFNVTTVTTYVTNEGWVEYVDYDIDYYAASKQGTLRITELGETNASEPETGKRPTFLMLNGDSYVIRFIPSDEYLTEGYMSKLISATVTANVVTATGACTIGQDFTFGAPAEATVFFGSKRGSTHFVPFEEVLPKEVSTEGDTKFYTYSVTNNSIYNYRVKQEGKLTHAGKLTAIAGDTIEITAAELDYESPKYINHNTADNSMLNVADILLNINKKGLLRLDDYNVRKDSFQIVNLRIWQLTDNSTGNYFMEPDFHYTILNENFEPSTDVIEIDEKGMLRTVGNGRAIVQVTYDAVYAWQYSTNSSYMGGALWSAIWPENTGTFVVTVGEEEDETMTPNLEVETELEERLEDGNEVDSEHDIFYYMEDQPGYYYTFKPTGIVKVEVANPDVKTNPNIALYNGFSEANVTKTDNSYTVLLTYGRNIIRMTSATGNTTYQVMSAKPVGYEIINKSRPGIEKYYAGDTLNIQFHGFFHPASKIAGIYNQSAYIYYNGVPNGTSLILSPNQYTFAGNPAAQNFQVILPDNWNDEYLYLKTGALQVSGFGDRPSSHRGINLQIGRNPNFTAPVHVNFWGSIPNVDIPIEPVTDGVKFEGLPEGIDILVISTKKGNVMEPNDAGIYMGAAVEYSYEAFAHNKKAALGTFTIEQGQGVVTITLSMDDIDLADNTWDGKSVSLPEIVSLEESETENGEFEGLEGYYKIKNGYELAWLAYYINKSKDNATSNAILIRDIDLGGFNWTPIGTSYSYPYSGVFEGAEYTVKDLFIDSENSYVGLFSYITRGVVKNLSVEGSVYSTDNYVGGIVGYLYESSIIYNCHNKASITGKGYVGGIAGYAYHEKRDKEENYLTIHNCTNSGDIRGTGSRVGGIAGYLGIWTYYFPNHTAYNLSNSGNVTAEQTYAGGITGQSVGFDFVHTYNTADVNADNYAGGITGSGANRNADRNGTNTIVTNSYNTGSISNGYSIIGDSLGIWVNTFTTEQELLEDDVFVKTTEEFASGKIAWLLGEAFGQIIGEEEYPVFNGQKVHQAIYSNNLSLEPDTLYTNGDLPVIEKEGYIVAWYDVPYGSIINSVSEDANIYLLYTEVDEIVPTTPTQLDGIPTETTIVLTWTASTDNVEVTGYTIYVDDEVEGISQTLEYTVRRLTPDTEYIISVEAFDDAGNKSDKATVTIKTLSATTSLSDFSMDVISVYPNPFTDYIIIDAVNEGKVQIFDLAGKPMMMKAVKAGSNTIDASVLPTGTYILRYGENTFKLIK